MKSYKHKDKRVHIPSKEGAGYEDANANVKEKATTSLPLNPVVHRGQDAELFWKGKYRKDNEIAQLLERLQKEGSREKLQEGISKLKMMIEN